MRSLLLGGSYSSGSRITSVQRCINLFPENTPQTVMPPVPVVHRLTPGLTFLGKPPDIMAVQYVIDGGGSAITTGFKGFIPVPFNCKIIAAELLADQSCSAVVDIWSSTLADWNPPTAPTSADSICATALPTLTASAGEIDATLTGWETTILAGAILAFNVNSNDNALLLTVSLTVVKA